MRLVKQGVVIDVKNNKQQINEIARHLTNGDVYCVNSMDYAFHAAAYVAWKNVGGKLLIQNPLMPEPIQQRLYQQAQNVEYTDVVMIPTSGTTGVPKLRSYGHEQDRYYFQTTMNTQEFDKNTKYLCFVPPFVWILAHIHDRMV